MSEMMWYGGPWGWGGEWFGLGGIGMMILGLLGLILFVVGIIYIFRWIAYTPWHGERQYKRYSGSEESLEILKRRYASGEINREEYEKMKKDLGF